MKKAKIKEQHSKKDIKQVQEPVGVKSVIVTLAVILITFGSFYLLTDFLVSKRTTKLSDNSNTSSNTNRTAFLNMLEHSNKEYYVFALTNLNDEAIYQRYVYSAQKSYYVVDMNDTMNKVYMADKTTISESVKDIRISDTTLFVIKDGKITKHFTGYKDITSYLQKQLDVSSNIKKK